MLVKAQYHVPVETYDYLAQVSREEHTTPGAKLHEIIMQYKLDKKGETTIDESTRKRGKHPRG